LISHGNMMKLLNYGCLSKTKVNVLTDHFSFK
jgi:hypothetical protein